MTTGPRLLFDTCAAIWFSAAQPLSPPTIEAIKQAAAAGEPICVSPITAWEVGLLVSKGRMNLRIAPDRWFATLLDAPGLELAAMPPSVLVAASFLPGAELRDPADRILAATAREYGYRLVTRDRPLLDYAKQGHIDALAC